MGLSQLLFSAYKVAASGMQFLSCCDFHHFLLFQLELTDYLGCSALCTQLASAGTVPPTLLVPFVMDVVLWAPILPSLAIMLSVIAYIYDVKGRGSKSLVQSLCFLMHSAALLAATYF